MKQTRLIAFLLLSTIGVAGVSQAAVIRQAPIVSPLDLIDSDSIATGDGNANNAESFSVELTKKKPKKKKKTKAS